MNLDIPKCSLNLLDKPLIEYLYDSVSKIKDIDNIYSVVGYKKEIIEGILKDKVKYIYQDKIEGTGYAMKCVTNYLDTKGYSLIIPGDTPLIETDILSKLIDKHITKHNDLTILTTTLLNPSSYGRIIRKFNKVKEIKEELNLSKKEKNIKEVNTSIYCINNKVLKDNIFKLKKDNIKNEYYLTDIVKIISNKYKIDTLIINNNYKLLGINDLFTLNTIEYNLQKEIINKHIRSGVIIKNPNTIFIGYDVIIGNSTIIKNNTILKGKTIIGTNCIIGPFSYLDNVICNNNINIISSYLKDSFIDNNSNIGPFSHLRLNTKIGPNCRVGNFTELKDTTFGKNVKASHLAYLGNTLCGDNINIGCGVITANYDGKNKYSTNIGSNSFIGCNSVLISPINIGANTYIASTTVLNKDLNDDEFAISRPILNIKKNKFLS